jgi:hypothetical protein
MGFVDWLTGKIAAASELNVLKNSFRDFEGVPYFV